MKKEVQLLVIILCIVVTGSIQAQLTYDKHGEFDSKYFPSTDYHYQEEYTNENVLKPEAWTDQGGLHAAFGSTDQLYFRREKPNVSTVVFRQNTWKAERVNMQVLIWSSDTLEQVRLKFNDLTDGQGHSLSSKYFDGELVRYVISNYPYGARDASCGGSPYKNGFMMPDRFEPLDRFQLLGKTTRPIWVSINVPADIREGIYTGTIDVSSTKETTHLKVSLNIQNQVLPQPHDWTYRLDLWQNPWAVAYINHLKPWSKEHITLLKQHLKMYADAGGKFITTYAVHSPWADNSFMTEGGMIEWVKKKDGSWGFDYSIFDQYVQLAMDCGIDKAITIYTPVPNGNRFRYMDEATGNYMYPKWIPGTENFDTHWTVFLTNLRRHLEQKGWFDRTYIGINESDMHQSIDAIKTTKAESKDWKITYAGDWHPELDTLLDDYSFVYGKEPNIAQRAARKARGVTSTFYVCCTPPYPNNFLFSPPIQGRWISWYSAACGYDGFLRWAYDAWTEDPDRDARHGSWAAGDCYMVYPGGHSCIRFEKLREGIVDFEKIHILRQKAALYPNNKRAVQLIKELDELLVAFTHEHDFESATIEKEVKQGRAIVDELSNELK